MSKVFKLSDIKYLWVLLLSMAVFLLSFCVERYYDATPLAEAVMYGVGFVIALAWGILNYVSHLKLDSIYKRYDSISVFVEAMKMSNDEKAELLQYLNDFAKDLEEKGEPHDNAVKKAISHFQVQEFMEVSGGALFENQTHWYMIGYVLVFLGIALITSVLYYIFEFPVFVLAAFTLILYSVGFVVLFFLYKVINTLIENK